VAESGVAAGIRRVEAVTGDNALTYLQSLEATVNGVAGALKATPAELGSRIGGLLEQVRALEKEIAALKGKLASSQGDELLAQAVDVKGIQVLAATLDGADAKTLRDTLDQAEEQAQDRRHRAGRSGRRQGAAGGGRHRRLHRQGQGRRAGELRRPAGGRQGRRQARHGDGRRHRRRGAARGAGGVAGWVAERV
jgi:alanyl-tRNA synthetase